MTCVLVCVCVCVCVCVVSRVAPPVRGVPPFFVSFARLWGFAASIGQACMIYSIAHGMTKGAVCCSVACEFRRACRERRRTRLTGSPDNERKMSAPAPSRSLPPRPGALRWTPPFLGPPSWASFQASQTGPTQTRNRAPLNGLPNGASQTGPTQTRNGASQWGFPNGAHSN